MPSWLIQTEGAIYILFRKRDLLLRKLVKEMVKFPVYSQTEQEWGELIRVEWPSELRCCT